MGRHSGEPAPDEDAPVPFWPAKPLAIKNLNVKTYASEPTLPCCVCTTRINPRREVHYSQGERRWCESHGAAYGPGSK